ncbi:MAG: DUF3108 domain-containing protein [Bacteroidales bacterium]|nr:DUF3108 domain-containing protein [Bacteroidales bacterium]
MLYFCFLIFSNRISAQCIDRPPVFEPGETIHYEVAYNWGFLWVDAGEVYFKADTVTRDGKFCYYFDSFGKSYSFYDWIFKVRDRYQSYVDTAAFQPISFIRDTYEGGYEVNNRYDFDFDNGKVKSSISHSDKPLTVDTLEIKPCTFDVLTAIYYARNLDFDGMKIGDTVPIWFIIDGEIFELYIRYLGREKYKNRDGIKYNCIKFSAMLVEGTIFKGGEDLYVWVTDDRYKIPIMVEAKIIIGSVKAYLIGYEGIAGFLNQVNK